MLITEGELRYVRMMFEFISIFVFLRHSLKRPKRRSPCTVQGAISGCSRQTSSGQCAFWIGTRFVLDGIRC